MTSSYKRLGDCIQLVDVRNSDLEVDLLLGLSIDKIFIPSVANTVGTNMRNYKIIKKGQFACSLMQVRRDKKIPVALMHEYNEALISQAYTVFEICDEKEVLPEYLMMWMSRSEFDRHACFLAVGGVRGSLEWEDFCNMEFPFPDIETQREIVREYKVIVDRIKLNEQLCAKLEETAQALYKHWFGDLSNYELQECEFSDLGPLPPGWETKRLRDVCSKIGSGATPRGGKANYQLSGISLIRSTNIHDLNFLYEDLAFINDAQASKLDNVTVLENDVLINITGASVARCSIVPKDVLPARVNQHVCILRCSLDFPYPNFLALTLTSFEAKKRLLGTSESGSTREALTKGELEEFEIVSPPQELLEKFESFCSTMLVRHSQLLFQNHSLAAVVDLLLSRLAVNQKEVAA